MSALQRLTTESIFIATDYLQDPNEAICLMDACNLRLTKQESVSWLTRRVDLAVPAFKLPKNIYVNWFFFDTRATPSQTENIVRSSFSLSSARVMEEEFYGRAIDLVFANTLLPHIKQSDYKTLGSFVHQLLKEQVDQLKNETSEEQGQTNAKPSFISWITKCNGSQTNADYLLRWLTADGGKDLIRNYQAFKRLASSLKESEYPIDKLPSEFQFLVALNGCDNTAHILEFLNGIKTMKQTFDAWMKKNSEQRGKKSDAEFLLHWLSYENVLFIDFEAFKNLIDKLHMMNYYIKMPSKEQFDACMAIRFGRSPTEFCIIS